MAVADTGYCKGDKLGYAWNIQTSAEQAVGKRGEGGRRPTQAMMRGGTSSLRNGSGGYRQLQEGGTNLGNAWLVQTSAEHAVVKQGRGRKEAHPGNDEKVEHRSEMAVADTGNGKGGLIW